MATIKCTGGGGVLNFNDPNNWQFGTVPGPVDIAQFDQNVSSFVLGPVPGNVVLAELLITGGQVTLFGSYTLSGIQSTELAVSGADLFVEDDSSINGNGNISVSNGALDLSGALSGASLTVTNGDLVLLGGSLLAVGTVNLNTGDIVDTGGGGGELSITNAIQITGSISFDTQTEELLVTGTISDAGSLTVNFGNVELDSSNTYSGGTMLSPPGPFESEALSVGNGNALGTGSLTIAGGELLATTTETIPNALTMSGSFTIAAADGQTLTFPTGHWTLNASSGEVISFGAPGLDGTIVWGFPNGATINNGGTYTVAVQAGTLRAADGGLSGLLGQDQHTIVQTGATLDINGTNPLISDLTGGGHVTNSGANAILFVRNGNFSGVIDGTLRLVMQGPGTLTLSGTNTYTGTTSINPGTTLILGAGGTTGSVSSAIIDSGVLAINRSDNFVVNNVSGSGQLQQIGPGNMWLGTGLSYTGGTLVSDGTLIVNDPAALGAGTLTLSGGELAGGLTGTINNHLEMNNSFTIAAAHGQTLTLSANSWTVNPSASQVITFGAPGQDGTVAFGGSSGTINGVATYSVAVQAGTLRSADARLGLLLSLDQHTTIAPGATLDAHGFNITLNDLQGGGRLTNLGIPANLTVNGGNFSGVIDGSLGLLDVQGALLLSGNSSYFGGTTIEGGATLTLGAGGTTGSVPGAVTDNGVLAINRSDSFVVNNVSGSGQLQQIGPGATTLGTGLNYGGGTAISAGTLVVNDPAGLGAGLLTINGGELLGGTTETISNPSAMSGSFTIAAAHAQTLTVMPSFLDWGLNTGDIVTFGASGQDGTVAFGALTGGIDHAQTYTILVQAGTLRPTADDALGAILANDQRTAIRPSGTLDVDGFSFTVNNLRGGGRITNTGGAATLSVNGGNFGGVIGGPLALHVMNSGALTLAGNNTYTGTTTIDSGATLALGNGGTTGSVPGAIADNGTLQFHHSGAFVEAGVISGSGNVVQEGPGTTVLTAINTYSGGTFLGGGTLEAQTPGAFGSGSITFLTGVPSTLRIDGTTMPGAGLDNFAAGDTIDLANITANGWSYAGVTLRLLNNGVTVAQLFVPTFFNFPLFALSGDSSGGTNIVLEPPPQDLNADNLADLVFQTPNNAFFAALSTGAGFTAPDLWAQHGGTFTAGEAQYADVNGDHRVDLIFQGLDNRFFVALSTGQAFTAPVQWVQHGGSFIPGQAQYADVNADGRADLIMQGNDNAFYVSLSTGGGFTMPALWVQHGGSFTAGEAQYADVNGDGRADLIFQSLDNRFFVSTSTGSGFTAPMQWMQHGGTFTPGQAQYADVNGDGVADLLFQSNDNRFFVSLSTGNGFTAPVQWMQHGGTFTAGEAQYADVNGDGKADLIFQSLDNRFFVSLSTGSGFTAPAQWGAFSGSFVAGQAQYADVNGDGKADLLFQASDNKVHLSLSSGANFGASSVVADFGTYGSFQPGTLHV